MPKLNFNPKYFTIEQARDLVDHLHEVRTYQERVEILQDHIDWSEQQIRRRMPTLLDCSPEQLMKVLVYADRTGDTAVGFRRYAI